MPLSDSIAGESTGDGDAEIGGFNDVVGEAAMRRRAMGMCHANSDGAAADRTAERVEKGTKPRRLCQRVLALSEGRFSVRTAMMTRTTVWARMSEMAVPQCI